MKKAKQPETLVQLEFDRKALEQKKFTLANLIRAKMNRLADKIDLLSHSDVVWLSRVEDFFLEKEYVTERHVEVLDSIIKRHQIH